MYLGGRTHVYDTYLGSDQELTVGPANREVPESTIAAHPPAQNPAKSQMKTLITWDVMRSNKFALLKNPREMIASEAYF